MNGPMAGVSLYLTQFMSRFSAHGTEVGTATRAEWLLNTEGINIISVPESCDNEDYGGCSDFCVPIEEGVKCLCGFGKILMDDQKTCVEYDGRYRIVRLS